MDTTRPHSTPSAYALEKAVRVAARRLGSDVSDIEIEAEAMRILSQDGFVAGDHRDPVPTGAHHFPVPTAQDHQTEWHLSVSAAPCASRRLNTQRARLYDRLRSVLTQAPYLGTSNIYLHVRDTSSLTVGHPPEALLTIAETLVDVVRDLPVSDIHAPFIDAALPENIGLLERIPELLALSQRLCPTVQIATIDNGLDEPSLEALCLALAVATQQKQGSHPLILSTQDCDRRAFGHRVHPEAIVAFQRQPVGEVREPASLDALPESWLHVASADLPLLMDHTPQRTTDHVIPLAPEASPESILSLVSDRLLSGSAGGARRQLMILC